MRIEKLCNLMCLSEGDLWQRLLLWGPMVAGRCVHHSLLSILNFSKSHQKLLFSEDLRGISASSFCLDEIKKFSIQGVGSSPFFHEKPYFIFILLLHIYAGYKFNPVINYFFNWLCLKRDIYFTKKKG